MCSAFTTNCGYYNSTIILIGDVYCTNIECSGKPCLHKKTFPLGRSDYQCPQGESVCQVRNVPFEHQTNFFSCRSAKGFSFLKGVQNRFQVLLEMSFVLASIVPAETNANILAVM